eukprot:TRINITY_DN2327_c0_g1_i1.p2 TRINITY_DN2327_c0_g1~~TRINITY_DN2327_c0_g1_i1.p2  ORF type:complete len:106 (+),score=19.72 TRINITY_DN2327_c0_g1_i1:1187-1504(+)
MTNTSKQRLLRWQKLLFFSVSLSVQYLWWPPEFFTQFSMKHTCVLQAASGHVRLLAHFIFSDVCVSQTQAAAYAQQQQQQQQRQHQQQQPKRLQAMRQAQLGCTW